VVPSGLATFRRKIHDFRDECEMAAEPPGEPGGFTIAAVRRAGYGSPWF
jgi:hypothetical protein